MNKRTLIACIALLVVLLAGIAVAVSFLYRGSGSVRADSVVQVNARERYPLLSAVPSDAAMVLCAGNMEDGFKLLTDSTKVFGTLFDGAVRRGFRPFVDRVVAARAAGRLRSLDKSGMAVSLYYSGDLVPLLVISAPADTSSDVRTLLAAADSAKMVSRYVSSVLLVSPSETLLRTAVRHFDGGLSILDQDGFAQAADRAQGEDALFFSNVYAGKLFADWLNRPFSQTSSFFTTLADWLVFPVSDSGETHLKMKAGAVHGESTTYFLHVPMNGEIRAASVLPASTHFAVDLPVSDVKAWIESYRKYLDAAKKLGRYKSGNSNFQKAMGLTAEQWAERLDIKEIAKAALTDADGVRRNILLIRPGKAEAEIILRDTGLSSLREYKPAVLPFAWRGFPSLLFGGLFNLPDDTMFTWLDGWMIIGDTKTVGTFVTNERTSLRTALSEYGLENRIPDRGTMVYTAMSSDLASEVFRPDMAAAWKNTLKGIVFEPAVLSLSGANGTLTVDRAAAKTRRVKAASDSAETAAAAAAEITVPTGPFTVRNSGTGKDNAFSQSANGALQLRDENGKTLWSVPFKESLCGYVEQVDYYANGKIQFLFAAGSKLYLIDRLGRMVSGFPSELGKEVLLGPAAYDFTGAHGYTAMVLHKDNTIGMYDLHGKVRDGWKGISSQTQITSLPELVTVEGKKYWVVPTVSDPVVYGFYGGDPVGKNESKKVLKARK